MLIAATERKLPSAFVAKHPMIGGGKARKLSPGTYHGVQAVSIAIAPVQVTRRLKIQGGKIGLDRSVACGPIEVLFSSGGALRIGVPGGCVVGIGGSFHAGIFGRFDWGRCWKHLDN